MSAPMSRTPRRSLLKKSPCRPATTSSGAASTSTCRRPRPTLKVVIPLTLLIILVIIYLNTKSLIKTGIIFLALPLSLVGCFWFLYLLGYNMSVAVWVGVIALAGISAETGVVMLLYLDLAYELWVNNGRMPNLGDLTQAIHHGAVKRIRPKVMTICVIIAGLVPIMWSHGAGADVMKRIAAPMVGGVVTSGMMELLVFPVIYFMWRGRSWSKASTQPLPAKSKREPRSPIT